MPEFPIFPEQASTIASRIDSIYFVLIGLSLAFAVPIAGFIIFFAIRYRQGQKVNRTKRLYDSFKLEFAWSFIPLLLALGIFGWSATVYYQYASAPADALEIYVTGKQWMWKVQHPSGRSEINELHVPVNQPVKLIMTSQDVIHSFYVPAFRVKQDVLPGRYTNLWFEANKVGEYHLFCAEYCGTDHARMTGTVVVMEQTAYERWLAGGATGGEQQQPQQPLAEQGAALFQQQGCASCHAAGSQVGPPLEGLFGKQVELQNGSTVEADEAYIREAILDPQARIVAGYSNVMPTYEGRIDEDGLLQLVEYIKSLEDN